jgi:hypothetical protein
MGQDEDRRTSASARPGASRPLRAGSVATAAVVTAAFVALASVVVLVADDGDAPGERTSAVRLAPLADDPGVVHVHGLGVDPADGTLYAATHSGLFRIPETGPAQRVANRAQDTMGFAVVGPGRFIGSGHPDFREDDVRPPLLGLIESTDAGETWERLSLHGQADFHALASAHGLVYGYDSTSRTFMVSSDRRNWQRRAEQPMLDFAVSPTDPEAVLAVDGEQVWRSDDRGQRFVPVPDAPRLAFVTWPLTGSIVGVDGAGTVHVSSDGGATWTARGRLTEQPVEPEALEAVMSAAAPGSFTLYAAARGVGIIVSDDDGRTFRLRYAED